MSHLHRPLSKNFQLSFSIPATPESLSMPPQETTSADSLITPISTEPESSQRTPPPVSGQEKAQHRREQIRKAGQRHRQAKAKYLDYLEKAFQRHKSDIATANTELSSLRREVKCLRAALARGIFSGFASNYYGAMGQQEGMKLFVTVLVAGAEESSSPTDTGAPSPRSSSNGTQYSTSVGSSFETTPIDACEDNLAEMDALLAGQYFPDEPPQMHL